MSLTVIPGLWPLPHGSACEECQGTGTVTVECLNGGVGVSLDFECPVCGGWGEVEDDQQEGTLQ